MFVFANADARRTRDGCHESLEFKSFTLGGVNLIYVSMKAVKTCTILPALLSFVILSTNNRDATDGLVWLDMGSVVF